MLRLKSSPGIVSIMLRNLPYQFNGLRTLSSIVFALNAVIFLVLMAA